MSKYIEVRDIYLSFIQRNQHLMSKISLDDSSITGVLRVLKAYYVCPKDANGKRLGPLVGYTATYAPGMHWVGDAYLNFAELEQYPAMVFQFAQHLWNKIVNSKVEVDAFFGAPLGGNSVAEMLALVSGARYVYPEKEILVLKTESEREKSRWIWGRHKDHLRPGDRVAISEDLTNNFASADKDIELAEKCGALVTCIVGWYNRSVLYRDVYPGGSFGDIPVITLDGAPLDQYRQDDPFVAADVAAGNVVWKPKHEWPRLEAAMAQAAK